MVEKKGEREKREERGDKLAVIKNAINILFKDRHREKSPTG